MKYTDVELAIRRAYIEELKPWYFYNKMETTLKALDKFVEDYGRSRIMHAMDYIYAVIVAKQVMVGMFDFVAALLPTEMLRSAFYTLYFDTEFINYLKRNGIVWEGGNAYAIREMEMYSKDFPTSDCRLLYLMLKNDFSDLMQVDIDKYMEMYYESQDTGVRFTVAGNDKYSLIVVPKGDARSFRSEYFNNESRLILYNEQLNRRMGFPNYSYQDICDAFRGEGVYA